MRAHALRPGPIHIASAAIATLLAGAAMAQPAGARSAEQPSDQQPPPPLLSGPTVEAEAAAPTLVRLAYNGRIERIADAQPEVAALELIELDEDVRLKIDAALEERAAFLDRAVLEHYETLLELYTAFGAGEQREVIRLYIEFTAHLQPLFEDGGLGRQLGAHMPMAARREYGRLLREYYAAVAQDSLAHPEEAMGNPPATSAEAIRQYKVGLLMEEVGRSFARIVEQKTQEFEDVLAALQLSPEREAEVRAQVEVLAQEVGLNPTEAQKRQIFVRVMEILTPPERQRLLGWVLR